MDEKIVITESPNLKSLSSTNSEPKKSGFIDSIKSSITPNSNSSTPDESTYSTNSVSSTAKSVVSKSAGFFSSFGWSRIVLIIVVLLFLGVNIFSGLAEAGNWFTDNVSPVFKKLLGVFGITTVKVSQKAVDVTATGAKTGIDIAAGTLDSGLDVIEGQLKNAKQNADARKDDANDTMNVALADAVPQVPEPDDATSNTQKNTNGKAGYCYIGEDRGFRSCIKVKEDDTCMSGQIFPTNAICVNPNLRE